MTAVLIPVPGGWLTLSEEQFEAAFEPTPTTAAATPVELLDAKTCAARLGVTARWLEDAARIGMVPHHKLGRFVRFNPEEVAAHTRASAGAIPGTDRAATDLHADGDRNSLNGKGRKRDVSRMSPGLSRRGAAVEGGR